ncbi:MAG TPA: right-handed parallel beta-helix repeat-containing protein [Gemmatimonadales bacterium]|nr:right-handed parallel beta-helix repeat-containing protein [Gemmatimonadales bacterium]
MKRICVLLLLALVLAAGRLAAQASQRPTITPRAGLVITSSVRVTPGTYRFPAPESLDSAVITIRGNGITVDLAEVTLEGMDPAGDPDRARGVAIRIDGGSNIRIINATIRGYRIAIYARGTRGLDLTNNDASYNWKPRLYSLIEHESLVDWLSFHHNEKDEWLRYAGAFFLVDVRGGLIHGNHAVQGMNGLMLTRSDSLRIERNDFSFNSGLGIGLYRSSDNTIVGNRIDFDVRGYSHRFYRRGQDSAGLLLYEQSSRNVVAYNSATHGGDGLFLWAGQSTMDTGEGGANDNLFVQNDFSFAPANAMEATFSRNSFVGNRAEGSDYGLWGGYSYGSLVAGNCFIRNRIGVAIEHGQDNTIRSNRFHGDSLAINLWGDPIEPSDWGYPKHRDTQSRDYRIERNVFAGNHHTIQSKNTNGVIAEFNDSIATAEGECSAPAIDSTDYALLPRLPDALPPLPGNPLTRRDRSAIIVDEWGPYDWRSPRLWPVDSSRADPLHLAVLGPRGAWRVIDRHGIAALSKLSGRVGDTIRVTPDGSTAGEWDLTLEYRGGETVSPRGERRAAGRPYRFSYRREELTADWSLRFYSWTDSTDLRKSPAAFEALLASPPILTRQASRLDYEWYRPLVQGVPLERWALEATATIALAPGAYTVRTISDDGIQVWAGDRKIIDNWTPHESVVDTASIGGGTHRFKVRYYQADGWTELRLEILRRPAP